MATYIGKTSVGIVFYTAHLNRVVIDTIPFGAITAYAKKVFKDRTEIVLTCVSPTYHPVPTKYRFNYENIALPLSANPDDLIVKLQSYNLGYAQNDEIYAAAGQTTYTITDATLRDVDNFILFINGVLQDKTSIYTYNSSTGVVTFNSALIGGELIQIVRID
jgi:hypothetical protein